jgi:hypothetical protein
VDSRVLLEFVRRGMGREEGGEIGEGKEDVPVKCACEDEIIVYTQFIQSLCEITLVD